MASLPDDTKFRSLAREDVYVVEHVGVVADRVYARSEEEQKELDDGDEGRRARGRSSNGALWKGPG